MIININAANFKTTEFKFQNIIEVLGMFLYIPQLVYWAFFQQPQYQFFWFDVFPFPIFLQE